MLVTLRHCVAWLQFRREPVALEISHLRRVELHRASRANLVSPVACTHERLRRLLAFHETMLALLIGLLQGLSLLLLLALRTESEHLLADVHALDDAGLDLPTEVAGVQGAAVVTWRTRQVLLRGLPERLRLVLLRQNGVLRRHL